MVSFIIPAYNEEKTIAQTIDSILKQETKEPFEVIVVDNASTDRTAQIVSQNFPSVKLVREERRGTTWARNRGAQEATGEILAFIDADIIVPPDWTEKVLRWFNVASYIVAVSGPYDFRGLNIWERFWQWAWYHFGVVPTNWFFHDLLHVSSTLIAGNFAVRKKIFDLVGGFDTEKFVFWGEDTDLAKRLMKFGKIKYSLGLRVETYPRGWKYHGQPLKEFLRGWKMIFIYGLNFYWVTFFNRPFSKKIKVIR